MTPLSPKHEQFVAEYLIDLNATQAAIRAGYSPRTAKEQASRLLTKVHIQAAISKGSGKRFISAEVSAERVLRELQRIAFADLRTYFDGDVLRRVSDLDADEAAAIVGFDVVIKNVAAGDGHTDTVHKIKLADKVKALEILAKYRQLFAEIVRHEGKITLEQLVAGSMGAEPPTS